MEVYINFSVIVCGCPGFGEKIVTMFLEKNPTKIPLSEGNKRAGATSFSHSLLCKTDSASYKYMNSNACSRLPTSITSVYLASES